MNNNLLKCLALISLGLINQTTSSAQALYWLTKPVINIGNVPNGSIGTAKISTNVILITH